MWKIMIIIAIASLLTIAVLVNNAFKTVQQSTKDREDAGVPTHVKDI